MDYRNTLKAEFALSLAQVEKIAADFCESMENGLAGKASPLKMLPSFLQLPRGNESGRYLAVDFGGSNLRVLEVALKAGTIRVLKQITRKLPDTGQAEALFGFIATMIQEVAGDGKYRLGHTFSFPCRQTAINTARLITWTKEINTAGVEGQDINRLLAQALRAEGLARIVPAAVLNDTVGTLLTAAYRMPAADIASICGTGHNTCYLEKRSPLTGKPMVINMESGNFDRLPANRYDDDLDAASEKPGEQRLEKMVAGRYLGELARLIILDLKQQGLLSALHDVPALEQPYAVTAEAISSWMTQEGAARWLEAQGGCRGAGTDACVLTETGRMLMQRSAWLVAATFIGVLRHSDPLVSRDHVIAVDGALYEQMPGFAGEIDKVIGNVFGTNSARIKTELVKDGSGQGAAIAAALSEEEG
jgi:hexokinase